MATVVTPGICTGEAKEEDIVGGMGQKREIYSRILWSVEGLLIQIQTSIFNNQRTVFNL